VGPAQPDLVPGGLGGGQHDQADIPDIGPVPPVAQDPGLAGEELPGAGDQARRGGRVPGRCRTRTRTSAR
jgi:hypothetical protein